MSDGVSADPRPSKTDRPYAFRLLRYAPNLISGEFFNLALLLYDADHRLIDARFAPDFQRMRCHPAVEMDWLQRLRDEFEEHRLLGESFQGYLDSLGQLSASFQYSDPMEQLGPADAASEMDDLVERYLATPPALANGELQPAQAGTRRYVRQRMQVSFERHGLFLNGRGLQTNVAVPYAGPRRSFQFDFGYEAANGAEGFLQALGVRNESRDADQLCFVYERLLSQKKGRRLDVVHADEVSSETRELLEASRIAVVAASQVDTLAQRLRVDLGLQ